MTSVAQGANLPSGSRQESRSIPPQGQTTTDLSELQPDPTSEFGHDPANGGDRVRAGGTIGRLGRRGLVQSADLGSYGILVKLPFRTSFRQVTQKGLGASSARWAGSGLFIGTGQR